MNALHLCKAMQKPVHILVRLPNWLGDMVMALGFLHALQGEWPEASISVIVKKGLQDLLPFFPTTAHRFVFDKSKYKGLKGVWRFGREIKKVQRFDLFFCLPDSLSSAVMARATGASQRIGFASPERAFLLTKIFKKPMHRHRAEVYVSLLESYLKKEIAMPPVLLQHSFTKQEYIVVNINSEAQSRRLTVEKAVAMLQSIEQTIPHQIFLIGAPKEESFVHEVLKKLPPTRIRSKAGQTTLPQLVVLLASARAVLSTDSGPAHLANALRTPTVVLFGAGNELETAPYNKSYRTIIRLGELSCEPCEKNICVRFPTPQCLERLSEGRIVQELRVQLKRQV